MFEQAIESIIKKDEQSKYIFKGVFARNELPEITSYPSAFIFNTQDRDRSGEHWLAVYFDSKNFGFFFDSYGQCPCFYGVENYLKKYAKNISYNQKRIQGESEYCGLYSILFIFSAVRNQINKFLSFFSTNLYLNDLFIFENINKKLN
jgi:hypothetical protein